MLQHSLPLALRPVPLLVGTALAIYATCSWATSEQSQAMAAQIESSPTDIDPNATIAEADSMSGSPETELVLTGNAEIRQPNQSIAGDEITYTQATGEVRTVGNARIERHGVVYEGEKINYYLDDHSGQGDNVTFDYGQPQLRGSAGCVRFQSKETTEMDDVMITTCRGNQPAWWIEADRILIDEYAQDVTARNGVLKIAGMPILGTPYMNFPLTNQRKSGFLPPTIGISSTRGFDVIAPYYFNLAPNYDLTLTPEYASKRGVLLGTEVRYLGSSFEATIDGTYMPEDKVLNDSRWRIQSKMSGRWNGFGYGINYNRVSDNDFLDDFSSGLRDEEDNILAQDFWLTYGTRYWNTSLRVNQNQTIDIWTDKPYERVPQYTWSAYVADFSGFELQTDIEATRFRHPTKIDGDRFVFHQQISYPIMSAGWFVTPKAQFIANTYQLDEFYRNTTDKTPSIAVPILSLDSGLIFDRPTNLFGMTMTQTLEPRLFYSYTPYRDQSAIPLFDSSLTDVSFASLFSENSWAGYDRIAETNQITGSVASRLIDDQTGIELLRVSIGQRYYFNDYTINSAGQRIEMGEQKSDFVGSINARITKAIRAGILGQYSWDENHLRKLSTTIAWQPRTSSTIALSYRYNWEPNPYSVENLDQIDLSLQWPLNDNLYLLARQNYSFYDNKFIETLAGLEYHSDCYTFRAVAQRYTRDGSSDETAFFIQLELLGFASLGSDPVNELKRSIQGYRPKTFAPTSSVAPYDNIQ